MSLPRLLGALAVAGGAALACTAAQVATSRRVIEVAATACALAEQIRQCVERQGSPSSPDGGPDGG